MELHTNSSNNTIYADADGNIAYFHSNFIPKRDPKFDWTQAGGRQRSGDRVERRAVDRRDAARCQPADGWLYNTNNWPWSAAGANSPKQADYPVYVDRGRREPARHPRDPGARGQEGLHARLADRPRPTTAICRRSQLLIPRALEAYDQTRRRSSPLKTKLAEQIATAARLGLSLVGRRRCRRRSRCSGAKSSGAASATRRAQAGVRSTTTWRRRRRREQLLQALAAASDKLTADFGTWKTPWGDINRFQRLTGDIVQPFNDAAPSIPVGFTSARWGSLASFGARTYPGTKKMYGTSGNSFVAVVEFGDSVRARAVTAGGESGDPKSTSTSTTRRSATPRAICARCTSTGRRWKRTRRGRTNPANRPG